MMRWLLALAQLWISLFVRPGSQPQARAVAPLLGT
jgi:hypothetical protein